MATATKTVVSTPVAPKEQMNWGNFNSMSVEGHISHAEIQTRDNSTYVVVNVMTNLKDGAEGTAVQFTNGYQILTLAQKGYLTKGRRVIITGSVSGIETHYTTKDGECVPLKRGRIQMTGVSLKLADTQRN